MTKSSATTPLKKKRSTVKASPVAVPEWQDGILKSETTLAVFVIDRKGAFHSWNDGAEKLFGYTSAEMVDTKNTFAALTVEQGGAGAEILARAWEYCDHNKRGVSYEMLNRSKDGRCIWMNWHFIPVAQGDAGMSGLAGLGENITARMMAENHLVESQQRYVTLVRLLPDIVFVIDEAGNFTFINESVGVLGYTAEELIGKHFSILIHPDDFLKVNRDAILPAFRGTVTGPLRAPKLFDERRSGTRKTANLEVRLIARLGSRADRERVVIISSVNASGLYNQRSSAKEFSGTIGVMRDITERRQAEEEREHLEHQLNHARKMEAIGQLAGGIAHDFNNMLSGITGYAEVIRQRNRTKEGQSIDTALESNIEIILKAAERAGDLTMKLLAFSRQGKYQVIPVDIHERIAEVVALLSPTIDRRIRITTILEAVPSRVMGDPTQLENAILNMAMNACDAMPEGGVLTLSTSVVMLDEQIARTRGYHMETGRYVLLIVNDTGIGMSEPMLQRIFEPFFTTKPIGKGTGLGLASVYGTVKSHHGAIDVESQVGAGTTFKVYLPVCKGGAGPSAEPEKDLAKGSGNILVVDDEEIVRNILARMLEEVGYVVATCNNGGEAVAYYREHGDETDLIILDMNMPVMSGSDCFYELKKINPDVKVVISTGYTVQTEAHKLISESAVGLIQKPFKFATLADEIHRIMRLNVKK
jgi:PAS domain S-box-containing protein